MSSINLEEFHGLKCSRPNCGGDAEIYEEWDGIYIRCKVCTNNQIIQYWEDERYLNPACSDCGIIGDANDILYGDDSDAIKIKDLKDLL